MPDYTQEDWDNDDAFRNLTPEGLLQVSCPGAHACHALLLNDCGGFLTIAVQWTNSPARMKERSEPGVEYMYNNTGYGLLALLVQRVVGRSFAEHMAATVFRPLGMTRTR